MFTGIIEELGRVVAMEPKPTGARLVIACSSVLQDATVGASIAVNGACLTAVEIAADRFAADLAPETLQRTNLGELKAESVVNLERPLRANARLDGHFVLGHVDATAEIVELRLLGGDNWWLTVSVPLALSRYIVEKGSLAVDGMSLTVAGIQDDRVSFTIIPHTYSHTTLRGYELGARVNVEVDILAKHLEKLTLKPQIVTDRIPMLTSEVNPAAEPYHIWYYTQEVWRRATFLGVACFKSVSDLWNYQEILHELKPALIVEFGTYIGGSALYFSEMLKLITPKSKVFSVDIDHGPLSPAAKAQERIEFLQSDTTSPQVFNRIRELRVEYPGPVFFILDSDHTTEHVMKEMVGLRDVMVGGDYMIVEDGNINGHPVLPDWGPGPYEALERYFSLYPHDYRRDVARENKFGFTFAPKGFLIKN